MGSFRFLILLFVIANTAIAQKSIDETLEKYNSGSIPYVSVEELKAKLVHDEEIVLLDTRSREEFEINHLKNAVWIGYKTFDETRVTNINKDADIILYCSVGVRSEKIGEELESLGFKNIKNLYGGIFLWINKGYSVYLNNQPTNNIHTYNKRWAEFIKAGNKIY